MLAELPIINLAPTNNNKSNLRCMQYIQQALAAGSEQEIPEVALLKYVKVLRRLSQRVRYRPAFRK